MQEQKTQEWQSKKCTQCLTIKPISEFHKRKAIKSGYRSECKDCGCSRRNKYHYNNHSKSITSSKKWKEKNKEILKAYAEKYYKNNKDVLSLKKQEYNIRTKEQRQAYRLKNKARYAMHKATRRFLEKASSVYNDELNSFIIEECYSLAKIRSEITGIKWHVDHIVPLNGKNVCGLHVGINLQVIPAFINMRKSNKHNE
jgi:hypothetical protein